jgi:hypothetical protein
VIIEGNNLEQTVYREPIKVAGEHRFIAGSCVDCGHPLAEECIPSPVSVPTGPPRVTKQDRLFVPMCSSQFHRFVLQTKTWELRLRRRQWTSKLVRSGRVVELRCGYGRNNTALWGRIGLVVEASSIPELYETVPYHLAVPQASTMAEALQLTTAEFFGQSATDFSNCPISLIAFEIVPGWSIER